VTYFGRGSGCEVIGFRVELGEQIVKIATREGQGNRISKERQ
jgi:hypothetical protein